MDTLQPYLLIITQPGQPQTVYHFTEANSVIKHYGGDWSEPNVACWDALQSMVKSSGTTAVCVPDPAWTPPPEPPPVQWTTGGYAILGLVLIAIAIFGCTVRKKA